MARLGRARPKRINNSSFLIQTGTVVLTSSSTLTTAGARVQPGALDLQADSSLIAGGTRVVPSTASLSASATLSISGTGGSITLPAASTLTVTGVGLKTADPLLLTADSTISMRTAESGTVLLTSSSTLAVASIPGALSTVLLSADARLTAPGKSGVALLVGTSYLIATGIAPSHAPLTFFDMSVNVTPPNGYFEPMPITLGANWQPNDYRIVFISAQSGPFLNTRDTEVLVPLHPDPPPGFTAAYNMDPGVGTRGVYYRRLVAGDQDTSVSWPKPPAWQNFMVSTMTVRGVGATPTAGVLGVTYAIGDPTISVSPVTVPATGAMVLFLGTLEDPGGRWLGWATATGVPDGWTPLVATDKSGATFFPYDSNPSLNVVAKNYSGSGTTGTVAFPTAIGSPAFVGMYAFFRPGADVSITVGAA